MIPMQESFDFVEREIGWWRERLTRRFGRLTNAPRRKPLSQLVKSMLSSRTRDPVSLAAYQDVVRRWPKPAVLAEAPVAEVERTIAPVTFAETKAVHLVTSLKMIGRECPDYRLGFLGGWPEPDSLLWLERHPGVGRKVAAATLNASTLRGRVFIVDSHVHRVLRRLGFIGDKTTPRAASELVTASAHTLGADDLLELFSQMKRLGQTLCRFESPYCTLCPLAPRCRTGRKSMDALRRRS